jgi:hypothetical protein
MMLEPPVRIAMLTAMPKLLAFAISLCRNRDQAEDLVQDTMLRACANIKSRPCRQRRVQADANRPCGISRTLGGTGETRAPAARGPHNGRSLRAVIWRGGKDLRMSDGHDKEPSQSSPNGALPTVVNRGRRFRRRSRYCRSHCQQRPYSNERATLGIADRAQTVRGLLPRSLYICCLPSASQLAMIFPVRRRPSC